MITATTIATIYSTAIVMAVIIIAATFLISRRHALQNQTVIFKELHYLMDRLEKQERALVQHVGELHRKINHHVERLEEQCNDLTHEVKHLEKGINP